MNKAPKSKKRTKRVREQAAIYCSVMACWFGQYYTPIPQDQFPDDVLELGESAFYFVTSGISMARSLHVGAAEWAEAEALLRTGWRP